MMHYHPGKLIQNDPGFLGKADFFCFLLTLSLFFGSLYPHYIYSRTSLPPDTHKHTQLYNRSISGVSGAKASELSPSPTQARIYFSSGRYTGSLPSLVFVYVCERYLVKRMAHTQKIVLHRPHSRARSEWGKSMSVYLWFNKVSLTDDDVSFLET